MEGLLDRLLQELSAESYQLCGWPLDALKLSCAPHYLLRCLLHNSFLSKKQAKLCLEGYLRCMPGLFPEDESQQEWRSTLRKDLQKLASLRCCVDALIGVHAAFTAALSFCIRPPLRLFCSSSASASASSSLLPSLSLLSQLPVSISSLSSSLNLNRKLHHTLPPLDMGWPLRWKTVQRRAYAALIKRTFRPHFCASSSTTSLSPIQKQQFLSHLSRYTFSVPACLELVALQLLVELGQPNEQHYDAEKDEYNKAVLDILINEQQQCIYGSQQLKEKEKEPEEGKVINAAQSEWQRTWRLHPHLLADLSTQYLTFFSRYLSFLLLQLHRLSTQAEKENELRLNVDGQHTTVIAIAADLRHLLLCFRYLGQSSPHIRHLCGRALVEFHQHHVPSVAMPPHRHSKRKRRLADLEKNRSHTPLGTAQCCCENTLANTFYYYYERILTCMLLG
ncbi:hypothetical protein QOT17_012434 [Balamuthia mandrillaris]